MKNRKSGKRFLGMLLAVVMAISVPVTAIAIRTYDKKDQQEETQEKTSQNNLNQKNTTTPVQIAEDTEGAEESSLSLLSSLQTQAAGQAENVNLIVNASAFTVNGVEGTKGTPMAYAIGTEVTVTFTGEGEFLYWRNASGKIISKDKSCTFPIVSATELTAVLKEKEGNAYVEFLSAYGQIMESAVWSAEGTEYVLPEGPDKVGYVFQYWSLDGEKATTVKEIQTLIGNGTTYISLLPVYKKSQTTYDIHVHYIGVEKATETYSIGEGSSRLLTASEVEEHTFSYWSDKQEGGIVLSYNQNYRVFASRDITLYAVYDKEVTKVPTIQMTNVYAWANGNKNVVSFEATRGVPEGYTLIEHGMLISKVNTDFNVDAEQVIKLVSSDSLSDGVYIANVNLSVQLLEVYARGYMIVKNNTTGAYETVYTAVTTGRQPYFPMNRDYDVLNDFEEPESTTTGIRYAPDSATVTYENAHKQSGEHAAKLVIKEDWSYVTAFFLKDGKRLEEADWKEYEYIKMYLYSEQEVQFYIHEVCYNLVAGENVITITSEDILGEVDKIRETYTVYDKEGAFFLQMRPGTFYIDSIIGVYPNAPDMEASLYFPQNQQYDTLQDFENGGYAWHHETLVPEKSENHVMEGTKSLKLTSSLDWKKIVIKLLKDGERLEEADWKKYTYINAYVYAERSGIQFNFYGKASVLKRGANKITITPDQILEEIKKTGTTTEDKVYDAEGGFLFEMTKGTVYVDSIIGVYPVGYQEVSDYYPTDRTYDVLQDFENDGVDFCASSVTQSYETRHIIDGKSTKFMTDSSDAVVVMKLLKDGVVLKTEDWQEYEYIQAYVYSEKEGAKFDFYCKTYELQAGPNIIKISSEDLLKEIQQANDVYDSTGGFYFRVTTGTIYVDSIIGVYPKADDADT